MALAARAVATGGASRLPKATDDVVELSRRRPPVMADVARLAGVSHQTVSRVLNEHPWVKAETRRRVLDAIHELGYRPNSAARALVTGRSRTLGVVSGDTTLYGPASTLFSIEQAARAAGYFVIIVNLNGVSARSIRDAVDRLRQQAVDGIIVLAPDVSARSALGRLPHDVPLVALEATVDVPVPVVSVDQYGGAAKATRYLLDLGHETVWHVSGPRSWFESRDRERAWQETLAAAGAPVPPVLVGDWSARSGYENGRRLAADPAVTAVFAGNDQMALGVLCSMHEAERAVPGEVSIVGFDDIPEASYFTPSLTTVRQNFSEVGRRSLEVLLSQLDGDSARMPKAVVPVDLIVRNSATTRRAS